MKSDTRTRTDRVAEANAKIEALHERLTAAVEGLVTSEDWRQAIAFSAKFRSRSFRNCALIAAQHAEAYSLGLVPNPTPTYVAGYRQWQSLGRAVRKGARGYQIFAPVSARFASETPADPSSWRRLTRGEKPRPNETARTRLVGLRVAYVWDISSTDGPDVAELPRPVKVTGAAPDGLWNGLKSQITEHGFEVQLVPDAASIGGAEAKADYTERLVSVRQDMSELEIAFAACHELAHVKLHRPDGPDAIADAEAHRGIREVEAESVAMLVAAAHGLDLSGFTIPYVSSWATTVPDRDPVAVVQSTAERVRTTALSILDQLDTDQIGNGDPPGLTRRHQGPAAALGVDASSIQSATETVRQVGR